MNCLMDFAGKLHMRFAERDLAWLAKRRQGERGGEG